MDSPNTKISRENWSLVVVRKFIAERIISYRNRNENSGILLTNREFHLQTGNLAYKTGFSFTKRDSWVTKGILGLLFTPSNQFFPRSYSYYNRNKRFELIKLLENQELLNECGIYFCTGIYFFKLALCQSFYYLIKIRFYRLCLVKNSTNLTVFHY